MPELHYDSNYTGTQIDEGVGKSLPLDTFASATNETIGGKQYHILWKVAPTNSNTVYGVAVDPTTGSLIKIKSANNTKSVVSGYSLSSSATSSAGAVAYLAVDSFDSTTGELDLTTKYLTIVES